MNDLQRLKYDLSLHYASVMVQNDISSGNVNSADITRIRNNLISYATDFVELLNNGTMDENILSTLLEKFI